MRESRRGGPSSFLVGRGSLKHICKRYGKWFYSQTRNQVVRLCEECGEIQVKTDMTPQTPSSPATSSRAPRKPRQPRSTNKNKRFKVVDPQRPVPKGHPPGTYRLPNGYLSTDPVGIEDFISPSGYVYQKGEAPSERAQNMVVSYE